MNDLVASVLTPQHGVAIPEAFQITLIEHLTGRMLGEISPPCLLRAPTGSGKTFVLSRTLSNVSAKRPVVWFWFVPYTNLVTQTLDDLVTNATDLTPTLFRQGINQDPQGGQVLISTVQGVSRSEWRKAEYDAGGGEQMRTPAEFLALCRGNGLDVGVVIDEAHIALDKSTEFGLFVRWLHPQYLAMATATPRSQRINEFLASADMSSLEAFNVARDDVVKSRLNKAFIEAVVYQLRENMQEVADLKRTVLRQAWLRNLALKRQLADHGIDLTPLLLVQVDNGKGTIEEAEKDLVELCKVPMQAIGKHSSDEPNPEMMDAIANDASKEVLIFKQSAGTGFNAPRAFVLASLKSVSDTDFAMQFIGRVMRVSRTIRNKYDRSEDIPADLNTAYVYLANAEAQQGFQNAVQITGQVRSALEGASEKLYMRKTKSGAQTFTNRPTAQPQLDPRTPFPSRGDTGPNGGVFNGEVEQGARYGGETSGAGASQEELTDSNGIPEQPSFDLGYVLDEMAPDSEISTVKRPDPRAAVDMEQWQTLMAERGIRVYPINEHAPEFPVALQRESRPSGLDMGEIAKRVATRVEISDRYKREAVLAARDRLRERERHTELTTGRIKGIEEVRIVVDRNIIARQASSILNSLPQIEPADHKMIVDTLAKRVEPTLMEHLIDVDEPADPKDVLRLSRTAAYWLVRLLKLDLEEALFAEVAKEAIIGDAEPLPRAMLFPVDLSLLPSEKNLYGVLPPTQDELAAVEQTLVIEDRALLQDTEWHIGDSVMKTGRFDSSFSLNNDERAFADALDRAGFVAWWFRNPDKKPYSVRLVRGEHQNYFYPDFVVCLEHVDGQRPMQRLIETKHDVKDARRKAKHIPKNYGKVLFLTRDNGRLHVVTDEGGLGAGVDLGELETLRSELQKTAP